MVLYFILYCEHLRVDPEHHFPLRKVQAKSQPHVTEVTEELSKLSTATPGHALSMGTSSQDPVQFHCMLCGPVQMAASPEASFRENTAQLHTELDSGGA